MAKGRTKERVGGAVSLIAGAVNWLLHDWAETRVLGWISDSVETHQMTVGQLVSITINAFPFLLIGIGIYLLRDEPWFIRLRGVFNSFEVIWTQTSHGMEPKKRLEAKTKIKFLKDIKEGRLILRAHCMTGQEREPIMKSYKLEDLKDVLKGQERVIILAVLPIAYPGWTQEVFSTIGPNGSDISLTGDSENVVEIELEAGCFIQRKRFYINNVSPSGKGPALYAQCEDKDVFEV